jgi:hypothetical protein
MFSSCYAPHPRGSCAAAGHPCNRARWRETAAAARDQSRCSIVTRKQWKSNRYSYLGSCCWQQSCHQTRQNKMTRLRSGFALYIFNRSAIVESAHRTRKFATIQDTGARSKRMFRRIRMLFSRMGSVQTALGSFTAFFLKNEDGCSHPHTKFTHAC